MSDLQVREEPLRIVPTAVATRPWRAFGGRASLHLVERHARVGRHLWLMVLSGIGEPLFYLLSIGVGLGQLVGTVGGVSYTAYVAPALLATSSMNGAIYDSTFNVFFLIKYAKTYDAALATPMRAPDLALGQVLWALIRSALYAFAFTGVMLAMGLFHSYWAIGVLPAAVLTGFAFATPVAAWTVTLEKETPLNYVFRFVAIPMMLFSGTFYPVSRLPGWLQPVAYATPLWHGAALCRGFSLGIVDPGSVALHVSYLTVIGGAGLWAGAHTYRRRLYV
jgi:lipooligosaccharide transport system permease protein